jgi:sterol desaturase/sphingolipid hydroxylase (fatty acid hydroxylase superfamily)
MHSQGAAYWSIFVVMFLAVAAWESVFPWRKLRNAPERRWANHSALFAICLVASAPLMRLSVVATAALASRNPFGLLHQPWMPEAVRWVAAILLLDMVHYWVHWAFHHVAFLWRVHEVHHSDPDFDVSTSVRFHPIEVVGSQLVFLAGVALLAPPPAVALLSELLSLVLNFFTHANAAPPAWADSALRAVFITPDMHRTHHSTEIAEQSTNLGQTFSFWDRLFGTYQHQPAAGPAEVVTGLNGFLGSESLGVGFMLAEPFRRAAPTKSLGVPAKESKG